MPFVLRRLGMTSRGESRLAYDIARGRLNVASAAATEIDRMRRVHAATPDLLDKLRDAYALTGNRAREELVKLHHEQSDLREENETATIEHLLRVEKRSFSRGCVRPLEQRCL